MKSVKVAGVVVLYNPTNEDISNIDSYINDIDLLYVMDNSGNKNDKRLPKNKKIKYIFNKLIFYFFQYWLIIFTAFFFVKITLDTIYYFKIPL